MALLVGPLWLTTCIELGLAVHLPWQPGTKLGQRQDKKQQLDEVWKSWHWQGETLAHWKRLTKRSEADARWLRPLWERDWCWDFDSNLKRDIMSENTIACVVVGDQGVGKTCLLQAYTRQETLLICSHNWINPSLLSDNLGALFLLLFPPPPFVTPIALTCKWLESRFSFQKIILISACL